MNKNGYLLDTDVLIAFLRGKNQGLKARIENLLDQNIPLYLSIISLGELYLGAFKSENPPKNLFLVNTTKEKLDLLDLTEDIVMLYGEIEAVLEKAGQVIGDFDVLIASTAIKHDVTLVSGNERHFQRIISSYRAYCAGRFDHCGWRRVRECSFSAGGAWGTTGRGINKNWEKHDVSFWLTGKANGFKMVVIVCNPLR